MTDQQTSQRKGLKFNWLLPAVLLAAVALYTTCGSRQEVSTVPQSARLIDVRTPGEFADRHHPGAENIPLDRIEDDPTIVGDPDQELIVYCRSGRRSGLAKEHLEKAGFTNVKNGGGLDELCRVTKSC